MATKKSESLLGDYRGTIGPTVLTGWLGIQVIKTTPSRGKDRKPQSKEQAEQSDVFGKVNHLLTPLRSLLGQSFFVPKNGTMTPFNAAVSELLTQALIEHEGKRYVDFNVLKLSRPKELTQQLWNTRATSEPGRRITISWELNPFPQKCTRMDDLVYIAYCGSASARFSRVHHLLERKALQHSFKLNSSAKGDEIFAYVLVISADGKRIAESEYLGAIPVLP